LRENLEVLDEAVANARKMSKPARKGADKAAALQWAKTLRDLVEVRNATLLNIKAHILGRDETGAVNDPANVYSRNGEVMFERNFRRLLQPWTLEDLKLKCEDCGVESEDVFSRSFEKQVPLGIGDMMTTETEHHDLCSRCYEKRTAKDERSDESEATRPISRGDVMSDDSGLEGAMTDGVRNIIRLARSDGDSPAEKIKMLEDFKAKTSGSADERGLGHVLAPGLALLDKEIERLQKEAELGKGQDAAGNPAT
jgi:hypothetical protein